MNSKHRKTLSSIFETPTRSDIAFSDIEALVLALDGKVVEREGSRIKFVVKDQDFRCHRPHPARQAKKYQVEVFREFLLKIGVTQ
ncbi:MAG: type II toxin-antitoxin system HicA family toxin [Azoarcus sp.]|jgi:hypothetical protein|nr:type II toxin-antitoxin system HicA family toxin [Azoarcus sp.]